MIKIMNNQHIRPWEKMPYLFRMHGIRLKAGQKPNKDQCEKIYAVYQRILVLLASKFIDSAYTSFES